MMFIGNWSEKMNYERNQPIRETVFPKFPCEFNRSLREPEIGNR